MASHNLSPRLLNPGHARTVSVRLSVASSVGLSPGTSQERRKTDKSVAPAYLSRGDRQARQGTSEKRLDSRQGAERAGIAALRLALTSVCFVSSSAIGLRRNRAYWLKAFPTSIRTSGPERACVRSPIRGTRKQKRKKNKKKKNSARQTDKRECQTKMKRRVPPFPFASARTRLAYRQNSLQRSDLASGKWK